MPPETMTSRDWRYERKFVLGPADAAALPALLRSHPAAFSECHPPRRVNSVYFDSPYLDAYRANVDGDGRRRKIRIRWYGDTFGEVRQPVLEYKERQGQVGTKRSLRLAPLVLAPGLAGRDLAGAATGPQAPPAVRRDFACLAPSLLNHYRRRYFLSADGRFRLTVDRDLVFHRVTTGANSFRCRRRDDRHTVLELKYALDDDDRAAAIANLLPGRLARHSKYVKGIRLLRAGAL